MVRGVVVVTGIYDVVVDQRSAVDVDRDVNHSQIAFLFRRAFPRWVGETGFFIRYLVHGLHTLLLGCFGWGGQGPGRPRRRHGFYVFFPVVQKNIRLQCKFHWQGIHGTPESFNYCL